SEEKIISPVVETEKIVTKEIAPQEKDLVVNLNSPSSSPSADGFHRLLVKGKEDKVVAQIDNLGNATFSGTLTAQEVKAASVAAEKINTEELAAQTASFSALYADQIISEEGSFKDLLAQKIASIRKELTTLIASSSASPQQESPDVDTPTGTSLLGQAENWSSSPQEENPAVEEVIENNHEEEIIISSSLLVQGRITVDDLIINRQLLASNILISKNSLNSLENVLYLQDNGTGKVDILAGILVVEDSGEVKINGNLTVSGKIAAKEVTAPHSAFGELVIKSKDNEIVAQIDASGSATFRKVTTDKLVIAAAENTSPEEETQTEAEVKTNATAGEGIIPRGETQVTIKNNKITSQSLVYITPLSDTQNQVLYIKNKKSATENEDGFFTVAINQPLDADIHFNWWIIN
ncbi:hypothetical protein J7J95_00670, partial [bacterium]|nr:hypothetical protein [bacterium]